MIRSVAIGALFGVLFPSFAEARGDGSRVLVQFAPRVTSADAVRLVSAIRAELGEMALVTLDALPPRECVVDVDRSGAGLVIRLTSARGRETSRVVAHGGELGATEAASIVRAFVLAATATTHDDAPPQATDDARTEGDLAVAAPPLPPRTAHSAPRIVPFSEHDAVPDMAAPAPWRGRVAASYTGATYASELAWQSGVRLEGAYAFMPGVYGGLTYALHPAAEIATESASVRTSRQSGAVFAGIERGRGAWALAADGSVGLEATTVSAPTAASIAGGGARPLPIFAVRLHGRWHVPGARGAALDVAPALELAPGRDALVVETAGSTTELTIAAARLRVDVGGSFDLF